jgi:cysteine desulfurase/selenocysteine lyase
MTMHRPPGSDVPAPSTPTDPTDAMTDGAAESNWLLPDEAALNRLAGEFFSALPSASPGVATLGVAEPSAPVSLPDTFVPALGAPTTRAADRHPSFNVHAVRNDFPILSERVNGHPLVWFDNAAATQKPRSVIERISYTRLGGK